VHPCSNLYVGIFGIILRCVDQGRLSKGKRRERVKRYLEGLRPAGQRLRLRKMLQTDATDRCNRQMQQNDAIERCNGTMAKGGGGTSTRMQGKRIHVSKDPKERNGV